MDAKCKYQVFVKWTSCWAIVSYAVLYHMWVVLLNESCNKERYTANTFEMVMWRKIWFGIHYDSPRLKRLACNCMPTVLYSSIMMSKGWSSELSFISFNALFMPQGISHFSGSGSLKWFCWFLHICMCCREKIYKSFIKTWKNKNK